MFTHKSPPFFAVLLSGFALFSGVVMMGQAALHSGSHRSGMTAPAATSSPNTDEPMVWVNTRTGVYHFPGTRWYGTTTYGKYLTVSQAQAEGDRPSARG